MAQKYTSEQIADIKDREAKALAYLKQAQLTPAAVIQKVNIEGTDNFVDGVIPYLMDTKYQDKSVISPMQDVQPDKKD